MLTLVTHSPDGGLHEETIAASDAPARMRRLDELQQFFWLDLGDPTPEEGALLSSYFRFHDLEIEDALQDVHHPKIEEYPDHLFLIVQGPRMEHDDETMSKAELDFFIGERYLVTHHRGESNSVSRARAACHTQ
ncbi:MAG: CorA family divalent cation transporter, partial [bacterium]